ncbi:MAG TPA: universal stress protein [Thermoanaerobaculia bacterium]
MSSPIKTVVVGTTLSEASDSIVAGAAAVARATGAALHLVNSYELPIPYGSVPYGVTSLFDEPGLVRGLHAMLEEQVRRLLPDVPKPVLHVASGPAHRTIVELARRTRADLIAVGAADTFLGRVFGTTASRVLRAAECPVLLIRGHLKMPPSRVLIPVDLSPLSAEEMATGLDVLEQIGLERGQGVVEAFYSTPPLGYEGFVTGFDPTVREKAASDELAEFLVANVLGIGWNLQQRSAFGPAREEILGRIQHFGPDLVVLGTHGAGGFERFLLGSVAETVLQRAPTSVLVVPPKAAREEKPAAAQNAA